MMIPILIIQLPFKILEIAFRLLPYAIKFAPLALLFIENSGENATECYAYLPHDATVVLADPQVSCYLVDLSDKENAAALAHEAAAKGGRMVFLQEYSSVDLPAISSEIYRSMKKNNVQFAYDERVLVHDDGAERNYNV
ncbi:MAG: hypothetical protein JW938_07185 [Candidatus Omnitrophica bacterium]|nr:hypothetical protein [Candidatus Omnitrophota bacterium]